MHKDLGLAVKAINETNMDVYFAHRTYDKFNQLVQSGNGKLDFSNIINY